jgi:hypothetical protein
MRGYKLVLWNGMLVCAVLTLSLSWAMAQQDTTSKGKGAAQADQHQSTIQGCLRGSGGAYSLTDKKSGVTYYVVGENLGKYAGQTVQLTGRGPSSAVAESAAGDTTDTEVGTLPNFHVHSIQQIAANCGR